MGKKLSQEEAENRLKNTKYLFIKWINGQYINNQSRVLMKCAKEHEWDVSYANITRGRGCPICRKLNAGNKTRLTNEQAVKQINSTGYKFIKWVNGQYQNGKSRLIAKCTLGHEWEVFFTNIVRGTGCPKCKRKNLNSKTLSEEEIISRLSSKGLKFIKWIDEFKNTSSLVKVCCENGHIRETKASLLIHRHTTCPKCSGKHSHSTKEADTKLLNNGFKVIRWLDGKYINSFSKFEAECPKGHIFISTFSSMSQKGKKCPVCSGRRELTSDEKINRINEKGFKFKSWAEDDHRFFTGECSKGHIVEVDYNTIVYRSGKCPECYLNTTKLTNSEFRDKSNKVHNNKYLYSNTNYKNSRDYVKIICKEHGEFKQTPNRHLAGRGCPTCGVISNLLSNRDPNDKCILYYLVLSYKGHHFYKVGITTKTIDIRYKDLHKDNVLIESRQVFETTVANAIEYENIILRRFSEYKEYRGHILLNTKGGTECFSKDIFAASSLAEFIKNYIQK